MDKGRSEEERSCIWIEKGRFYGMGYINQYADIAHEDDIKSLLQPYEGNDYMLHLIHNYAAQYPYKVLKPAAHVKEEQEHFYMD